MSNTHQTTTTRPVKAQSAERPERPTLTAYITGFALSLCLTTAAYLLVVNHMLSGRQLALSLAGLAVAQLLVQLLFFLHLGRESKPRWKLLVFWFMLLVLGILVVGSLWIMRNLDYHMMPPQTEINNYLHRHDAL